LVSATGGAPIDVSVVVVVRNGERHLADALASLEAQTRAAGEVVLVDGQSTDRTATIARSFERVRYVRQPDLGLASARNLGIARSTLPLVAFLDHDDLWLPEKLGAQVELLLASPELLYVTCELELLVERGASLEPRRAAAARTAARTGATPSALVAWRKAFDLVGLFDPRYSIGCDADWFARARDLGVAAAVVQRALVRKRLHGRNLSTAADVNRQELFEVARRSLARQRERRRPAETGD
jgi:glycosyltransferase involved in cell wall biosynthesis